MDEEHLQAVKSFKDLGLCDELLEAVKLMNWDSPTKVQAEVLPPALEGKDLTVLADTGTGKTAAFVLPILQALLNSGARSPFFACVLVPLRELAMQVAEQFEALGAGFHLKTAVLVGGIDVLQQQLALAKRPHIIVATPGRLVDHLTNTKGFSLSALKYLVLDEADVLLKDEFEKSVDDILKVIPRERRTYLFSATMTSKVTKIKRACLRNPVKIGTGSKYSTADTLKQQYLLTPAKYKDCYLVHILMGIRGSALVFTKLRETALFLSLMLRNLGFKARPIHGKMPEPKRLGALNKFKAGDCNILVCTDVLSRGHDIPTVGTVIGYCVPTNPKVYIHRVGRTARAGRSGVAISLVSQYEVEAFVRIENLIGKKLPRFPVDEDEALLLLERVVEAKRISRMTINTKKSQGGRRGKKEMDDEEMEQTHKRSSKLSKRKTNL